MKVNFNTIKKAIENSSDIGASNVRFCNETGLLEKIMRYENNNNFTISLYFFDDEMIIGYLLEDGTYNWFSTLKLEHYKSMNSFMFDLGCTLYRLNRHIEDYIIK